MMSYYDESFYRAAEDGRRYMEQLEKMSIAEGEHKRYKKDVCRSWIQFWIPLVFSIIALLKSYSVELALLWKTIKQLLK